MEFNRSQNPKHGDEVYAAIGYYRLSKDDGTSQTSDSIENQRILVHEYLKNHPNITLVEEAIDDGYTGTNFDRPGFQSVMDAINNGRVNCVIVKDLSRLGREYVETGKYLEMVFPSKGIRFIAINDDVDTSNFHSGDDILIPVKNIMNESYCRELSKKLRRQFKIQRKNGKFMGSFACYGYLKDPDDKHKLIVDPYAAEIVRMIFRLKIKGCSNSDIARTLDSQDVLPPAEYKQSLGLNYHTGLRGCGDPKWNVPTLLNIMRNPVYTGTLVQGITSTPNYKIKKTVLRDKSEWDIVPNTHEPIIDDCTFQIVQRILGRDTRYAAGQDLLEPLSGLVFCAGCGHSMIKRIATQGRTQYLYYICSNNKFNKVCSSHMIPVSLVEDIVLRAIQNQIRLVVDTRELLSEIDPKEILAARFRGLDTRITEKLREIDRQDAFCRKLEGALDDGLIDREEYELMKKRADTTVQEAQQALRQLEQEKAHYQNQGSRALDWMETFLELQPCKTLTRELTVALIDKVIIGEDKSVHIDFNFRDELSFYQQVITHRGKEAV